jgi:hypothetical protein
MRKVETSSVFVRTSETGGGSTSRVSDVDYESASAYAVARALVGCAGVRAPRAGVSHIVLRITVRDRHIIIFFRRGLHNKYYYHDIKYLFFSFTTDHSAPPQRSSDDRQPMGTRSGSDSFLSLASRIGSGGIFSSALHRSPYSRVNETRGARVTRSLCARFETRASAHQADSALLLAGRCRDESDFCVPLCTGGWS